MKENLLKDWYIVSFEKYILICGNIYNDTKCRWEDGTFIHTSQVVKVDFATGVVEALNTIYNLDLENNIIM